jgi:RNA polymerase sigma factor (sigma-70 family)
MTGEWIAPCFITFAGLTEAITYTESQLVMALKEKNEKAYGLLYDQYSRALFNVIYQLIPDQAQAEDALQLVFVKIWKNIDQFDASKGRLFTWMLNIARNQSIDVIRSKDFNNQAKTKSLTDNVYDNQVPGQAIKDAGLNKMIEQLPVESRKLLQLSYFMGYTQDEIARMLGIPLGTVKTRLRTIILQLRKQVAK